MAARGNAEDGNPRVLMALFASMANIQPIHVPYKGGGPMAASLMSGETQSAVATVGSSLPPLALGRVRALGVTSARRSSILPNVPTIAESAGQKVPDRKPAKDCRFSELSVWVSGLDSNCRYGIVLQAHPVSLKYATSHR